MFNTDALFRIQEYYNINMQKFLWDRYGVNYAFDTLIGTNYYDMCELTMLEYDKKIKLVGSRFALDNIMDKLDEVKLKYRIVSLEGKSGSCLDASGSIDESKYVMEEIDPLVGCLSTDDPYYWDDLSNYTLVLEKC